MSEKALAESDSEAVAFTDPAKAGASSVRAALVPTESEGAMAAQRLSALRLSAFNSILFLLIVAFSLSASSMIFVKSYDVSANENWKVKSSNAVVVKIFFTDGPPFWLIAFNLYHGKGLNEAALFLKLS